jgi:hypothetical protein
MAAAPKNFSGPLLAAVIRCCRVYCAALFRMAILAFQRIAKFVGTTITLLLTSRVLFGIFSRMNSQRSQIWRSFQYSGAVLQVVPTRPGVYGILKISRLLGLPASSEVIYVGKTLNLRRRLCPAS